MSGFDSRRSVMRFGLILLAVRSAACLAEDRITLTADATAVGRYEKIEFRIGLDRRYQNPFDPDEVAVNVMLQTPGGGQVRVPAFSCQPYEHRAGVPGPRGAVWLYPRGAPVWLARVAPSETGPYEAFVELQDRTGTLRSAPVRFTAVPSDRPGYVRVSGKDPRFFEFSNGTPFFPIGQNLAFIGESQYVTLAKVDAIFGQLADHGANYLRIWPCCQDWAMAIEARKSAWGRSWGWRPPFVPLAEAGETDPAGAARQCVQLASGERALLRVDPTHPVALRPDTRYALTGRIKTSAASRVQVTTGRHTLEPPVTSGASGRWVPFRLEFATGADEHWLSQTSLRLDGDGPAWLDGLSLQEAPGGPELLWEADVNRPARGVYNPIDCWMLDEVLAAAERRGLYLQLCLLTRDLYMTALKDEHSADYERAIADARKLLRYAVARWGHSPHVATWEYFNENDPGLPTHRFYAALGAYLEQVDVYRHLRQTSTWHPSPRDMQHPKLDVADLHFYLRSIPNPPYPDEAAAALGQAQFLREHAPRKPALIAEFGLANEKWQPTPEMEQSDSLVDFHNGLWASALSGTSGTAMFWWWDRLDKRNAYPLYRPLATFVAGVPWTTANLQPLAATVSESRLRLSGLRGTDRAYLWLFDPQASWANVVIRKQTPGSVAGVEVTIRDLAAGQYRVQWWDTWEGKSLAESIAAPQDGVLRLAVPTFSRDLAAKIEPAPASS